MTFLGNCFKPTCPVVFFERGTSDAKQLYTFRCEELKVDTDCYISIAIIKMKGKWTNQTDSTLDCVFALPTPGGTVMSVFVKIGQDRVLTTAIVPCEEALELMQENHAQTSLGFNVGPQPKESNNTYSHGLFGLPLGNIEPGDSIVVSVEYLQQLEYYKKGYLVSIPLYFPPCTIIESVDWHDVVNIECRINALSSALAVDSWSHELNTKHQLNDLKGSIEVSSAKCKPVKPRHQPHVLEQQKQTQNLHNEIEIEIEIENKNNEAEAEAEAEENRNRNRTKNKNRNKNKSKNKSKNVVITTSVDKTGRDFELSYSVRNETVEAYCIHEADELDAQSGTLCLFVTPPIKLTTTFGRAFFFLVDRSGSMIGEPFVEATRALCCALERLRATDQFNVCAFDHRQFYYESELVSANRDNVQNCQSWIRTYQPERGGTNMDVPINRALDFLESTELLPFIVLITDGAVPNERDICVKLEKRKEKLRTRFITFGIGSFCNWFFLKFLSNIGRGFCDRAVSKEKIFFQMDHLLRMANTPVLTDIEIDLQLQTRTSTSTSTSDIQIYPYPIQDLFVGSPVVAAVKYHASECPAQILIYGFDAHGVRQELVAKVVTRKDLPVEKLFVKSQIDLMSSHAWLTDSDTIHNKIVTISCNCNIPSRFTSTIMFETTEGQLEAQVSQVAKLVDVGNNNDNSISIQQNKIKNAKVKAKIRNNKKAVAALALGGTTAIIAVTVRSAGDIQSTIDNIPVLDEASNDFDTGQCCECFENCNCDCGCECDCKDCVIL